MLNKSIILYKSNENAKVKEAALSNIAYFAVAQLLLGNTLPDGIPEDSKKLAETEAALINEAQGLKKSVFLGFDHDYSQYKPRSHYTRSDDLKKYFKAMMWNEFTH